MLFLLPLINHAGESRMAPVLADLNGKILVVWQTG